MPRSAHWPVLLYRFYRPLARTWRIQVLMPDGCCTRLEHYPIQPFIYAHSEQDDLVLASLLGGSNAVVLVTEGRDGDLAARVLEKFGATVIRGSSLHAGSQALMQLVRLLRRFSAPATICVDGPLGPRGKAKPGVLLCARHTRRPIVPIAASASRALVFRKSWACMYLPWPFARVVIALGEPLQVDSGASRDEISTRAEELSLALAAARERAERWIHQS